jgi:hypothetical protein
VGADALVRIEAGGVIFADGNISSDGGDGEMEIEVDGFSGVPVNDVVARGKSGSGRGKVRGAGAGTRHNKVAGAVGSGGGSTVCDDFCVGDRGSGGIEHNAFDADPIGAALRASYGWGEESYCHGQQCDDLTAVCDFLAHVASILTAPIVGDGVAESQCRLSEIGYDNRHTVGERQGPMTIDTP